MRRMPDEEQRLDGEDWVWERTIFSPVCTYCEHLTSVIERKCEAFPDGIPREIWLGKNNHQKPYKGDHGIQFKKAAKL
jgi:hypothetical protein